jgi:hypothetical protein
MVADGYTSGEITSNGPERGWWGLEEH